MELFERIVELGDIHAIDFIGVAEISRYKNEIKEIGGLVADNYPRALSIGIVLQKSITKEYCKPFK